MAVADNQQTKTNNEGFQFDYEDSRTVEGRGELRAMLAQVIAPFVSDCGSEFGATPVVARVRQGVVRGE